MGFDDRLKKPPTDTLSLIIIDNACILSIIEVAHIELVDVYSLDIVNIDSQYWWLLKLLCFVGAYYQYVVKIKLKKNVE